MVERCWWCGDDPLYVDYHDDEWGVAPRPRSSSCSSCCASRGPKPGCRGSRSCASGTPTVKRSKASTPSGWPPSTTTDVERLLANAGIVRNRAKISRRRQRPGPAGAPRAGGTLRDLVWSHRPAEHPRPQTGAEIPAVTPEAEALSKELKRHGFRFVGPTIAYAFMQSAGLVDDHLVTCFRAT